jgi:regulator of sirC expression with transglutaminase-like and TPR domain
MGHAAAIVCPRFAFELLEGQLSTLTSNDALLLGGCAIAALVQASPADLANRTGTGGGMDALVEMIDQKIDLLADEARTILREQGNGHTQRLSKDRSDRLSAVMEVLFAREGFSGANDEYDHPRHSDLAYVLHAKRGLPISLCLLMTLTARRLSVPVTGIGLPGHFLVGITLATPELDESTLLIDAFAGGATVSPQSARKRVELTFGPGSFQQKHLKPVTHRQWLSRMLQNLLHAFERRGMYHHVAAAVEMQRLLWPAELHLSRDLGLVLARLGLRRESAIMIEQYLIDSPDDPQSEQLRQLLNRLAA